MATNLHKEAFMGLGLFTQMKMIRLWIRSDYFSKYEHFLYCNYL